ncbi:aldose 1-epimerase family protein [Cryobacterium sp. Y57]|uniref:aldose 1-epimerase family protein n=1 Tax=Cryobacterium sp. Y57 TaxID=2048287 RepID=UPI000CE2F9A2|nr:aldose 1-epimerase family protein [Cryobacterium sp. Y57]
MTQGLKPTRTFVGATGIQHEIAGFGYRAVITELGTCLRELEFLGRELIVSFAVDEPMIAYRGALAAPWPNRIADGQYEANGIVHQLPINEPSRNCALHGLVFNQRWHLVAHTSDAVTLGLDLLPSIGYPFHLAFSVTYSVTASGLRTSVEATNLGTATAPYGVCPHPYLRAGASPLNSWTLSLPADRYLEVSADRLLPLALAPVQNSTFDFRQPREIGSTEIDHAFTALSRHDGLASVELRERDGAGVAMTFDDSCSWVQIHTADLPGGGHDRLGLAVEPMTCAPDAFNSHDSLVNLTAGAVHQARWTISAIL